MSDFFKPEDFGHDVNDPLNCETAAAIANRLVEPLFEQIESLCKMAREIAAEKNHLEEELVELEGACLKPLREENERLRAELEAKLTLAKAYKELLEKLR